MTRGCFPVAILAGGLATRLLPLTAIWPKSLVDVGGKPFLFRQLAYLRDQGVRRVILCTGHLGDQIASAAGDGSAFGLEISYSPDGPHPLGTGGALRQALPLLPEHFFLLYGDSFLPCNFTEVQQAFLDSGRAALMSVLHNKQQWDRSNVLFRDGRILVYDKKKARADMEHIDYGLGVVSARLLDTWPASFDLADLYHLLSLDGALAGFETHARFYEIGTPGGLAETRAYFAERGPDHSS